MKKLLLSLAACASMMAASAGEPWQLGPYTYNADTLFHMTAGPGITTTGVRLSTSSNQTNIFYSTIDLTNPNLELRGVQAQDHSDKTENVQKMGDRKNTQGNGQYIAGVNSDFFNMGGYPTRTNGHSLVDGKLYNPANGGDFWHTWASYATVEGAKDVKILQNVVAANTINFGNKSHAYRINGPRYANYLVIYTPDSTSTGTNQWGGECTLKAVSGSLANNDAVFEVTCTPVCGMGADDRNMTVPRDGFVLSGNGTGLDFVKNLKIGDQLTLGFTATYNGNKIDLKQSVGGCSMIVQNGKIADDKYFSASVIDHFTSNQARTVIGYNEDRTKLIILVADKYSKFNASVTDEFKLGYGNTSSGMVLQRMGHIMLHLGCYTAMNFDGGGSSQLYNKGLGIVNTPYGDTYLRPVANGFFAVSTTPVDNTIAKLEVRQKNVKLAAGETLTPHVYGYNQYGVLVDTNVKGFTLTVAPSLGTVAGTKFTAGSAKGSTHAVVALGDVKCGMRLLVNGGGAYVTSGDDNAPLTADASYVPDEPLGFDREPLFLTHRYHFVNNQYNDGWDGTAPNWASDDAIKAKPCPRFATARNGRFYTVDMTTMSIAEIDNEGNFKPLYKLPSLEGRTINGVPDYYGCAITSDDAGNFLIGHLFTKADTYRVWTIYSPKTGKAKHFDVEIPEGEASNGRIDNIGRVVGDLTTEAYAYVAPKATGTLESQKVLILGFKGNGDVDGVTVTPTLSKGLYLAGNGNTMTTCQPRYATVAEMQGKDLNETFYWYSKAGGVAQYTADLFCFDNGTYSPNYCLDWNNYSRLNGFDTFVLNGKRYFALHYAADVAHDSDMHIIIKDEQGNTVADWGGFDEFITSSSGYNTITAVPVGANQVNIYVYNCAGKRTQGSDLTGCIAGALLTFTLGEEYAETEPADITPSGLNFDNYTDGDPFKVYAVEKAGAWSGPADFYHGSHPDAFTTEGQLTSFLYRGMGLDLNSQANVDAKIQPMVAVRKVNDHIGQALVINQQWSPAASTFGWTGSGFNGAEGQFSFYTDNHAIKDNATQKHYVRVRLVYNVLKRGCHHAQDVASNGKVKAVNSIYATHEGNWVVPQNDHNTGALYAETGMDFAKWVDETGKVEDIPAVPVVYEPADDDVDEWDASHHGSGCAADPNGKPAYLINSERYRVYEFDTYIDNPSAKTISVQVNLADRNTTYIIKEIKFTDLGTDEAAATLLGRRSKTWTYYNAYTSGIEDIVTDGFVEESDAPAVYYNLQGVQVKNPANGIYIVRRGNQVTKQYIR